MCFENTRMPINACWMNEKVTFYNTFSSPYHCMTALTVREWILVSNWDPSDCNLILFSLVHTTVTIENNKFAWEQCIYLNLAINSYLILYHKTKILGKFNSVKISQTCFKNQRNVFLCTDKYVYEQILLF